MISDTLDGLEEVQHDYCVVGGGPAGISFALEVASLGKSVLLLESGGMSESAAQQSLSNAEIITPDLHEDMTIVVSRQLGGTSNLWAGRLVPFDPIDFRRRSYLGEVAWPIDFHEIAEHYQKASDYLTGGQMKYDDPVPGVEIPEQDFTYTRLKRYSKYPALKVYHRSVLRKSDLIDIRLNSTVIELMIDAEGQVSYLLVARPDGSRHKLPVKDIVLACGGLETTRLLLATQRASPHLFGGQDGPLGKYYMGHLTGEIADITFSDTNMEAAFDYYLDADSHYVRRRIVPSDQVQLDHELPNIAFWPVVPPISNADHRSGILSLLFLAMATKRFGSAFVAEAIRRKHVPNGVSKWPHLANLIRELPKTALYGLGFLYKRFASSPAIPGFFVPNPGHRYGLSYHSEQSPTEKSKVYLSNETDRFGLPKLVIDFQYSEDDAQAIVRAHDLLGQWLETHKIGRLDYRVPRSNAAEAVLAGAPHGTHQIGTARIGEDRFSAVVDKNLRTFDCKNLYLLSSAVFRGSGQCNPTLTIAALGIRLAKHLSAQANTEKRK